MTENGISQPVYDNIYRPDHPVRQQLSTPHFRIIYPKGEESAAIQSAHILEEQYSVVQSLVGGSLSNMPVVLNSANDRSNGFVTTLNFRIEVEIPRILGKSMNPRDGNWLYSVIPHELVHALHLNVIPTIGVSGLIRPFSPDVARTMNMSAPLGMIEGIAVFHDTHLHYGVSGRGNHSYFNRQYQAVQHGSYRWTPSRHLRDPSHTYPFDRHYIGGFTFVNWLQYEYGMETTAKTIRFVSRWPFLGYGSALWYHTGKRPSRLFREFEISQNEINESGNNNSAQTYKSPVSDEFQRIRRPFWVSNETVLFHGAAYHKRPGIYSYNRRTGDKKPVLETLSTQDYLFSTNPDKSKFLFSRYHRHPYKQNYYRMRIHEVLLTGNQIESSSNPNDAELLKAEMHQKGDEDRLHAPVYGPENEIWALRTHHESNMIVRLTDHALDTLLVPNKGHFVELAFNPVHRDSLVLLANRNGLQGLWLLHKDHLDEFHSSPPDLAFEQSSIYDPDWHPEGNKLLFTSDRDGTMNLYEYHLEKQKAVRLSNHKWGLMEGRYSPDGQHIAAVQILDNRFELVIINMNDLQYPSMMEKNLIPVPDWSDTEFNEPTLPFHFSDNYMDSIPENWSTKKYRTGFRWIRPRSVFPYWSNDSNFTGNRYGLTISSGDVLRRNSYIADLSTSNNRFWYDLSYRFTGFYPGFRMHGYHRPVETTSGLSERVGGGLEIPFPLVFDQNTHVSSLLFTPGIHYLKQRTITSDGEATGEWVGRTSTTLSLRYHYRLQQNIRDVQPNTGWILFAESELDLLSDFNRGKLKALRGGIFRYVSTGLFNNQSLRAGAEFVTQNLPLYDITGFYSRAFDEYLLSGVNNASRLNTRYTIPVWHPDRGSLLIPFHFDRIYVVLFSDTIIPLTTYDSRELYSNSRSVFGGGIRLQMRIFNIPLNIGIAYALEPTRDHHTLFIGSF